MLREKELRAFKNIFTEDFHIPHGKQSVKIVTHVDLDGLASAVTIVNQLVKQGIPKERINIEFAQYGDEEKLKRAFTKKLQAKNKHQMVMVSDYAKLPKLLPYKDFIGLLDWKGNAYMFEKFMNENDFSNINEDDFERMLRSKFKVVDNKFTNDSIKRLFDACKAYSLYGKEDNGKITPENAANYKVQAVKPDFVADHHSNIANDKGELPLSGGKMGEINVKSPSECAALAGEYAPDLWSKKDLEAISMVDSAGYTEEELKNTIFLEKNFKSPNKEKNLATIISVLYDNLAKKDQNVCKWVILNSSTSLASLYNNTLKALKFNGERLELISALKRGDFETGKQIAEALPKILQKNWTDPTGSQYEKRDGGMISKGLDLQGWKEKNAKDLEDAKTGKKTEKDEEYLESIKGIRTKEGKEERDRKKEEIKSKKGKVVLYHNFAIFDGNSPRTQYSRYLPGLLESDGKKEPYIIRYWKGFFQISMNPVYSNAIKKAGIENPFDFQEINRHVIADVCNFLEKEGVKEKTIKDVREEMEEQNGGHKSAIWSFNGFDKIKPTKYELGEKYWDDRDKLSRVAKLNKNKGKTSKDINDKINIANETGMMKGAAERVQSKNEILDKYADIRDRAMKTAINSAATWINKMYPPIPEGLEALKNSDKNFEMKH